MKAKLILYGSVLGLLAYEAYALKTEESGDTISEIIWKLSRRPLVPFTIGLLSGHFVWQAQSIYEDKVHSS